MIRSALVAVALALPAAPLAAQVVWYVDVDNCQGVEDGTPANPFCSISAAIDVAFDGDEIVIAEGTYFELIDFGGKAITLRSTDPDDPLVVVATTIDGDGQGTVVTCISGEGPGSVLSGLRIIGGISPIFGGGMLNDAASPTVTGCIFEGNRAGDNGGGMANRNNANPVVTNCSFLENTVNLDGSGAHGENNSNGGGMYNYLSSPVVTNCTFRLNFANLDGGGMLNYTSNPTVTGCLFDTNTAGDDGGGLGNVHESNPVITGCTFVSNRAIEDGGGGLLNFRNSSPVVSDCVFRDNAADEFGGGMLNFSGSSPVVTNCIFSGNSAVIFGGGMANADSAPTVTNCTFYDNTVIASGGAVSGFNGSAVVLTNCILWGNSPNEIHEDSSTVDVVWCDVEGGYPGGTRVIDVDPLFVDVAGDDLHLTAGSNCIDAGSDSPVVLAGIAFDLDGNPRFRNAAIDLGALESNYCPADGDGDGSVGLDDFLTVLSLWGPCPRPCPADGDADGSVGISDFLGILSSWGPCP